MSVAQIPHVNVMSKLDLLSKDAKTKLERYLDPDMATVLAEEMADDDDDEPVASRFQKLNHTLAALVGLQSRLRHAGGIRIIEPTGCGEFWRVM